MLDFYEQYPSFCNKHLIQTMNKIINEIMEILQSHFNAELNFYLVFTIFKIYLVFNYFHYNAINIYEFFHSYDI